MPQHIRLIDGTATNLRAYRSAESSTLKVNRITNVSSVERKNGVTGMKDRNSCES